MTEKKTLTPEDREFFNNITRAIFACPFSEERDVLTGASPSVITYESEKERVSPVLARLKERLAFYESEGPVRISDFDREDSRCVAYALLFEIFYTKLEDFDRLISVQASAGDTPVNVPFAEEIIEFLAGRGFRKEDCLRYLAFFYQFRRACYFIERDLAGESECMKRLRRDLWNAVFTHDIYLYENYLWNRMEDFSILLLGETGSGRGAVAATIGRSCFIPFDEKKGQFTESFNKKFISINLSQFPENLIESELFGHRRGAFTGAVEDHEGLFARSRPNDAVFLDEIDRIPEYIQIKLLQVLQERTFSPAGSHEKKRFNGRIIAATSRSPEELCEAGCLRSDFFYRLCSDVIYVPPLRQRLEEDPDELERLVGDVVRRIVGAPSPELAELVIKVLARELPENYHWPGNVYELEQVTRRIIIRQSYDGRLPGAVRGFMDNARLCQDAL